MTFDARCAICQDEKFLFLSKAFPLVLTALFYLGILNSLSLAVLWNTSVFKWYSHAVGQLSKRCLDAQKQTYFKFTIMKCRYN